MGRQKLLSILLLACFSPALALEPPAKDAIERYLKDGSLYWRSQNALALGNHLVAPDLVLNLKYKLACAQLLAAGISPAGIIKRLGLPPGTTNTLKSRGAPKIFALLISFPDYPATESRETIMAKIFGDGAGEWPRESLRNYYWRSSYNLLDLQGAVLGGTSPFSRGQAWPRQSLPEKP